MKPLNDRQKRFVENYITSFDCYDAYKKAGYKGKGQTGKQYALRIFKRDAVQVENKQAIGQEAIETRLYRASLCSVLQRTVAGPD